MKYLLIFLTGITFAQSSKFIVIDDDTLEFISEVNYTLYSNNKPIYNNLTSKDSVTRFPKNVDFDSISFNKLNYKEIGFKKQDLKEVVYINKVVYDLNEVVIVGKNPKEKIIGEKSRFVKRSSNSLTTDSSYGLLFKEEELRDLSINKLIFFVEKVKYKTNYKVRFYSAEESEKSLSFQELFLKELLFESPVLQLEKNAKNKIEIDLENFQIDLSNKNVFVTIELLNHFDENNKKIELEFKNKTKLKFQLSEKINYYAKMSDFQSGELTKELININLMIKYDFAFRLFKTPHKSILIAPAILLGTILKNKIKLD